MKIRARAWRIAWNSCCAPLGVFPVSGGRSLTSQGLLCRFGIVLLSHGEAAWLKEIYNCSQAFQAQSASAKKSGALTLSKPTGHEQLSKPESKALYIWVELFMARVSAVESRGTVLGR